MEYPVGFPDSISPLICLYASAMPLERTRSRAFEIFSGCFIILFTSGIPLEMTPDISVPALIQLFTTLIRTAPSETIGAETSSP